MAQLVAHSLWERGVVSSSLAAPTIFMIDLRYIRSGDWISLLLVIILSVIGLLTVLSATYRVEEPYSIFFKKQLFGIISGLVLYGLCCIIDYRTFERWGYFLFFGVIALLLATMFKGSVRMGGQRWLNVGLFRFQPSECAKLFLAPYISYYLVTEKSYPYTIRTFLPILGILAVSTLLIRQQPDLGTAVIVFLTGLVCLWLVGIGKTFFLTTAFIGLIMAPLGWYCLRPYQRERITVFLGRGDMSKERYQIEQSKIAIGSGGWWGKGFLKGTQNKLNFLPEGRTDFIFAVFCEEWGFVGAFLLIVLYLLLFCRLLGLIAALKNFYAQILTAGLIIPLMISTIINIGMVTSLVPAVGIPLPFMTYGISHLWMSFLSLGVIQSVMVRRFFVVR